MRDTVRITWKALNPSLEFSHRTLGKKMLKPKFERWTPNYEIERY